MTIAISLALGAVIGILLGLLGGGGSILAVPALVSVMGLPVAQAIPMSLTVVAIASAVGVVPKVKARQVHWRLACVFAGAGIPATYLGTVVGRHLPQSAILIGFAAVMIVAGARMLFDGEGTGTACAAGESGVDWCRCALRSIPAAVLVGFSTGLFGVGGGFLVIPALVVLLGVEMRIAIGTSLLIIVANSATGVLSSIGEAGVGWPITAAFVSAASIGSLVAGLLGARVDTRRLQRWFAYVVFVVAGYLLVDTVLIH